MRIGSWRWHPVALRRISASALGAIPWKTADFCQNPGLSCMEKMEEIEEVESIGREVRTLYLLEHEPV
jgi:hypothetical protein